MTLETPINEKYAAIVSKISNVARINNCINLHYCFIDFRAVITDFSMRKGNVCLYFPPGTQLSSEYLYYNSLYKDNRKNRNTLDYGYFKNNGAVKCMLIRGNVSNGFIMPITSLLFTASIEQVAKLQVGQKLDRINGMTICRKYIPPYIKKEDVSKYQTE